MKISELIEKLSSAQKEYGDIEVILYNEYSGEDDHYQKVSEVNLHAERQVWNGHLDGYVWADENRLEIR